MNKFIHTAAVTLSLAVAIGSSPALFAKGNIVVANRASGNLSVIDAQTDAVTTVALPDDSQPMYVVHSAAMNRVFVGDRSNNRVIVLDGGDFSFEAAVPAGLGVFHMWGSEALSQLWVNNDIDNTITVIDTITLEVLATVPLPADLVVQGGKPHDVVLDQTAPSAFVTMLGLAGANDYVVKFDANTFAETARAAVGKDPHVSLSRQGNLLYVPCQNSSSVFVLNRSDLTAEPAIAVDAAHGAGMARNGQTFYTTNISGGGTGGLVAIDTTSNTVIDAVDTPFPVPHNIALTPNGKKIYITHSGGTADKVSIFTVGKNGDAPTAAGSVTVGLNPFGLAFVP